MPRLFGTAGLVAGLTTSGRTRWALKAFRQVVEAVTPRLARHVRVQRAIFFEKDLAAAGPRPRASVPLEVRVGVRKDFDTLAGDFRLGGLTKEEAFRRLDLGHVPVLAFVDGRLAYYHWLAFTPVWLYLGVTLRLEPGEAYGYDAVTLPAWRGRGIHGDAFHFIYEYERTRGCVRHLSYVTWDNVPALRVVVGKLHHRRTRAVWTVWVRGMRRPAVFGAGDDRSPRLEVLRPAGGGTTGS